MNVPSSHQHKSSAEKSREAFPSLFKTKAGEIGTAVLPVPGLGFVVQRQRPPGFQASSLNA
jgi:hypothetical protein